MKAVEDPHRCNLSQYYDGMGNICKSLTSHHVEHFLRYILIDAKMFFCFFYLFEDVVESFLFDYLEEFLRDFYFFLSSIVFFLNETLIE